MKKHMDLLSQNLGVDVSKDSLEVELRILMEATGIYYEQVIKEDKVLSFKVGQILSIKGVGLKTMAEE
jgi:hypothetical protein